MKNKNIFLGIILIIVGGLWFLNNMNLFDFSVRYLFNAFWKLWPLIIVVAGAGLILNNKTADRVLWLVFFLVIIGYAFFLQYGNPFSNNIDGNITDNRNNIQDNRYYPLSSEDQKGNLNLNIGATRFMVAAIESDNLIEVDSNIENLRIDVTDSGTHTAANIRNSGDLMNIGGVSNNTLDVFINTTVPWDLKVNCGAVDGSMDLSEIASENIDVSIGAGKLALTLGNNASNQNLKLNAGVSEIEIHIPESSAVKISFKGALNSTNIDSLGLSRQDNTYVSDNFDSAENKIEMDIEIGLGKLDFEYY